MHIEIVDPASFAGTAALILQASWRPPCLRYAPEWLRWQFASPGSPPAAAAAAFDGAEPVGFAALVPRRLRLARARVGASVLSFVAVLPGWRGRGIGASLYRALLGQAREPARPVVAFAVPGSEGQRRLLGSFDAAGFRHRPLGVYRTYGASACAVTISDPGEAPWSEGFEAGELSAILDRCPDDGTLRDDPTEDRWAHLRADPKARAVAVLREPGGEPAGVATVALAGVIMAGGEDTMPTIESVTLPAPTPEALGSLVRFAYSRWPGRASAGFVAAPNLGGIGADVLRAAGLRATPSCFEGYLFEECRGGPLSAARRTNLEIL